jgi:hypothetical protein
MFAVINPLLGFMPQTLLAFCPPINHSVLRKFYQYSYIVLGSIGLIDSFGIETGIAWTVGGVIVGISDWLTETDFKWIALPIPTQ